MKRALLTFSFILLGLYILLTWWDYDGLYQAEREFWIINKQYKDITRDPNSVPEAAYNELNHDIQRFIHRFPESKLTILANILVGRTYVLKKDYVKARDKFERIVEDNKDNPQIAIQALSEIGQTYALEENWEKLLATYQQLQKDYPFTELGMRAPLLVAQYYRNRNNPKLADQQMQKAIAYYQSLINQYPESEVEFNALRLSASSYVTQKQWALAINQFGEILIKYATPEYMRLETVDDLIKSINTIAVTQAKDADLAIDVYKRFLATNTEHPLRKSLEGIIASLEELKLRSVGKGAEQSS